MRLVKLEMDWGTHALVDVAYYKQIGSPALLV